MRLASLGARVAVLCSGILAAATTCQMTDVLKTPGVANVALSFGSDSILVVAAPSRPTVVVTVDGAPLAGARVRLASSDTEVVAVRGDTLVPRKRGAVTLTASLESSALPQDPPHLEQALVVVADTVTLDSAAVHLTSLGDTVTLAATARDALGAAIAGAAALWSSSDTTVAGVTAAGRLTARRNGTATVRAALDRDTATAAVTVAQTLVRWQFEPASLRIDALTATGIVVATGYDARGNAIAALAPTTWSVGDATIVSVSAPGKVTSLRNGSTYLYAVGGAVRDSVAVTVAQRADLVAISPKPVPAVTSVGGQVQLLARAFDHKAVEILTAKPTWYTLEPPMVRVGSDGLVTALATGTAHVVAALDAAADTASVTITNDPATVTVAPDSALATSLGDTLVFRAVARNGRGDSVAATVAWRTPDSTVVRLLADGRAVALAVGTARVIAAVGGKADSGLAKVTNVPVAIDIEPAARVFTSLGDVDTLPVTITNARGDPVPRGSVSWTSDDATIARVAPGGIVTARDTGQTVVRATSGSVTDSVDVTVLNVPASIIILGPGVDTLTAVGQSLTLQVDVRNARGAPIPSYPVAWSSSNRTTVDTVLPTGVAVAVGWGTTSLVARAGAVAATMSLTARNPTVLYVSNAVYQAPRVGTLARPYGRIQDAVDAADAGDTVMVLHGLGRYSESVNLVRRIVLMGDSLPFAGTGKHPTDLVLISHDTGAYAIRAHTTAPVTIKFLAITHTLDGPALDADGSDVEVQWVAVNRPGSVTSPVGRGISIANSNSGSLVSHSWVYNVVGYGIRFYRVNGGGVGNDSVDMVVAASDGADGSGIRVTGGTANLCCSTLRRTAGPLIHVDSTQNFVASYNDLAGLNRMIRAVDVGFTTLNWNTLRIATGPNENAPISYPDDFESAVIEFIRPRVAESITDNTFSSEIVPCSPVWCGGDYPPRDFIAVQDKVGAYPMMVGRNRFHGPGRVIFSKNGKVSAFNNHADSVTSFYVAAGTTDYLISNDDQVNAALDACFHASADYNPGVAGGQLNLERTVLSRCALWNGPGAIEINSANSALTLSRVSVTEMPPYMTGLRVRNGGSVVVESSVFTAGTSAAGVSNNVCVPVLGCGGIGAEAYTVQVTNTAISGFKYWPGLKVDQAATLTASGNLLHGNKVGAELGSIGTIAFSGSDVFDNDSLGLRYLGTSAASVSSWWGDRRGPRSGSDPAATGDAVESTNGAPLTVGADSVASHFGSPATALRIVRGVEGGAAGTLLARAFTLRVVDANGLPVVGVSVEFSVTGGGGNFGGQGAVTVVSNTSGLAEATLTLGTTPGINTVQVSAGGVPTITLTATGY